MLPRERRRPRRLLKVISHILEGVLFEMHGVRESISSFNFLCSLLGPFVSMNPLSMFFTLMERVFPVYFTTVDLSRSTRLELRL